MTNRTGGAPLPARANLATLGFIVKTARARTGWCMFALILICVAILCIVTGPRPSVQSLIAIVLTVIALLSVCLKWQPF